MALESSQSEQGAAAPAQSQLDPSLQQFADPSFDPVDYLNESLPPLTLASSQPHASRTPGAVSLADLSSRSQSLLSQLNTQHVRLSTILTQLTDEILRSSGRLAYEVEVLRGNTISLADTLTERLHDDIAKLVPQVIAVEGDTTEKKDETDQKPAKPASEPEYIAKLRTLNRVRARLEEVVRVFGDAMAWPLAPSELTVTSSFISVSGPEPGSEGQSQEEKGQEVAKKLRAEIAELLDSGGGGEAGVAAAERRIKALRELAVVWKDTVEEKPRNKFLDSLAKMVEDRRRALESRRSVDLSAKATSSRDRPAEERTSDDGARPAGGLFRNLQRIREEIYLD